MKLFGKRPAHVGTSWHPSSQFNTPGDDGVCCISAVSGSKKDKRGVKVAPMLLLIMMH